MQSVVTSPIYSLFAATCAGTTVIRAYGLVDAFYSQIEDKVDALNRVTLSFYSANRWLSIRLELCGNCISTFSSLAAVLAPLYLASFSTDYALLIAFALSQALSVTNTLGWSVRMWSDVEGSMNSVERAEEYVKLEPEAAAHVPDRDVANWPSRGNIVFRNVSMRYRPGLPNVLNGTTFEIKGGEKCGIVGRTGSGKSSIIVALFRLTELSGGAITIDGHNIGEMGLDLLRKSVSIVPQDPVLFASSVRSNLDPFSLHSDENVRAVPLLVHFAVLFIQFFHFIHSFICCLFLLISVRFFGF